MTTTNFRVLPWLNVTHHSHCHSHSHEAEREEADHVPVLAMLDEGKRQLLHRLRQRAGHDEAEDGGQEDEEDRRRDEREQDGGTVAGRPAPVFCIEDFYFLSLGTVHNIYIIHNS